MFAGEVAAVVARSCIEADRWSLVVVRVRNGKEARLWVDFSRVVIGGSLRGLCPAFGPWQGLHICGGCPTARSFHGELAELLVLPQALEDAQIEILNNYFSNKFS